MYIVCVCVCVLIEEDGTVPAPSQPAKLQLLYNNLQKIQSLKVRRGSDPLHVHIHAAVGGKGTYH